VARGSTWVDLNDDGNLDLVVVDLNGSPHVLMNKGGSGNHWLTIDARLPDGRRTAIGGRVTVTAGGRTQFREVMGVNGYLSQGDPRAHFGLGEATKADRVEIRWPDGRGETFTDLPADRIHVVVEEAH
jgi:hypothetical protein